MGETGERKDGRDLICLFNGRESFRIATEFIASVKAKKKK